MSAPVPDLTGRRLRNAEDRIGTLEETVEAHEVTLYALRRDVTGLKIDMATLLGHFGLPGATAEQVDAELERDA